MHFISISIYIFGFKEKTIQCYFLILRASHSIFVLDILLVLTNSLKIVSGYSGASLQQRTSVKLTSARTAIRHFSKCLGMIMYRTEKHRHATKCYLHIDHKCLSNNAIFLAYQYVHTSK
jgi:hypothetical protein